MENSRQGSQVHGGEAQGGGEMSDDGCAMWCPCSARSAANVVLAAGGLVQCWSENSLLVTPVLNEGII